jgi:hypothetical protein
MGKPSVQELIEGTDGSGFAETRNQGGTRKAHCVRQKQFGVQLGRFGNFGETR